MSLQLPNTNVQDVNIRSLSYVKAERISGIVGSTLSFTNVIDTEGALLFLNGALVDPVNYSIIANTIELDTPAIVSDVFVLHHHYIRPAGT